MRVFALVLLAAACGPPATAPAADVLLRLPDGDCRAGLTCTLDFGSVVVGDEHIIGVDALNAGDADAVILASTAAGDPGFALVQTPDDPGLAAGASTPLVVRARASVDGAVASTLSVRWAQKTNPDATSAGSVTAPLIEVSLSMQGTQ